MEEISSIGDYPKLIARKAREQNLPKHLIAFIDDVLAELRIREGAQKLQSDQQYIERPMTLTEVVKEMTEMLSSEKFCKKNLFSSEKGYSGLKAETLKFIQSLT